MQAQLLKNGKDFRLMDIPLFRIERMKKVIENEEL